MGMPCRPVLMPLLATICPAAAVVLGCCAPSAKVTVDASNPRIGTDRASASVDAQTIVGRTTKTFSRARFYKPREPGLGGLEQALAPLVVDELPEGVAADAVDPFIAVVREIVYNEGYRTHLDPERPTVYAAWTMVEVGGTKLDQVVYLWWYAWRCERCRGRHATGRGVRVVLWADGFPVVWEALSGQPKQRVFFVSQSLERAAKERFGDPLPGRRYSIERGLDATPDVIVARVIDDGPVPMGPYVYVGTRDEYAITTVLCRCMPSQMESVEDTLYYDLEPIEALGGDWEPSSVRRCAIPREGRFGEDGLWHIVYPTAEESLDRILRWPKI